MLPDNVNNIRLILEIEQIAAPYGMTLSNVSYDSPDVVISGATTSKTPGAVSSTPTQAVVGGSASLQQPKDYGTFNLSFSTSGTYDNFINFTKDLESNLRLVDISTVTFSSDASSQNSKTNSAEAYTYNFKIKTYWLKS